MKFPKMPRSLEAVKRFSMCNCLTLGFPQTYTAFALTMHRFLMCCWPGELHELPHSELRENINYAIPKAYWIPKRVHTFLFSPFNESYHNCFDSGDGIMSTRIGRKIKRISKKMPRLSLKMFGIFLKAMNEKLVEMWGDELLRIFVFYDPKYAEAESRQVMLAYQYMAQQVLDWPVVRVERTDKFKNDWFHYTGRDKNAVLNSIEELENAKI